MLIRNLLVTIASQEGNELLCRTAAGQELRINRDILGPGDWSIGTELYINIDKQSLSSTDEDRKQLLNEILQS